MSLSSALDWTLLRGDRCLIRLTCVPFALAQVILVQLGLAQAGLAQAAPADISIPSGASDAVEDALPKPSDTPLRFPASPSAPAPTLHAPNASPPQSAPEVDVRFPVRHITVVGSTVLQPEIAALVREYEAKEELSFNELLELRSRITQLYIEHGYITSGAFLPNNQLLSDGEIRIQVIEGRLEPQMVNGRLEPIVLCLLAPNADRENSIAAVRTSSQAMPEDPSQSTSEHQQVQPSQQSDRIHDKSVAQPIVDPKQGACGSARLRESYVRDRLSRAVTTPVNQHRIETALQLLQLDPLIQQVNAELAAGSQPGQSILRVEVREAPAFHFSAGGDNYQSPSIGSEQFSVQASYDNLLGLGDRISGGYGITAGLDSFDVGYQLPINAENGTLSFSFSQDESLIVENEFEDLEIRSDSETLSLGFRQPIVRTPETEIALGLQTDLRRSTTFLEDEAFSFSEGPEDGKANVTVVRLFQDWLDRNANTVLAARSQFSFGLEALDATVNDSGTDGTFFAWLGQFQWVQRVSPRWVLVSRLNAQLTPDSLLPLERFGYGGVDTLRGYRQNQLVTDNGLLAAIEARFSLLLDSSLQLIPFAEAGHGWNNQSPNPDPSTLASVGLGLRWLMTPDLALRIDYGIPLIEVENEGNSLQDHGLYFSLRYEPF